MKSKYDTRALRKEMARLLGKSAAWVVLRVDEQGYHLHAPEDTHVSLIGLILKGNPELLEITNEIINDPLTDFENHSN